MKKLILVIALAAILATGSALADHPSGFGIGVVGQYGWGAGGGSGGGGLSLKIPSIPIFWAVNLGLSTEHFAIGLTGDYYMIDQPLSVPTLNWFLGLGGFFNFYTYNNTYYSIKTSYTSINVGARVPIGLSWQPISLLELWIDLAPSLGLFIDSDGKYTYQGRETTWHTGGAGFYWVMPLELGIRLWF